MSLSIAIAAATNAEIARNTISIFFSFVIATPTSQIIYVVDADDPLTLTALAHAEYRIYS